MIYFDLVKFKAINDIFGILEGDKVLRYIGGVLKLSAGERNVCGCLGGAGSLAASGKRLDFSGLVYSDF